MEKIISLSYVDILNHLGAQGWDLLKFDRKIENTNRAKGEILTELFDSLISGEIEITETGKLIATLNYTKQLIISIIVGLLITFVLGIVSDYNLKYMIISFFTSSILLFLAGYLKAYGIIRDNLKATQTNIES